jgi:1-acyl-sn-glycerol-3-phosphate acyltransferase
MPQDLAVRRVIEEVTGRKGLGPEEPLDLDSLATVELVLALEEELGIFLGDVAPKTVSEAIKASRDAPGAEGEALTPGVGHLQWLAEATLGPALNRYFRLEVRGADRVPSDGPVVLASNHRSLLDIPFLVIASPRRVRFMAKRELFPPGFASWFFHALGGFPVDRVGPDVGAVRAGLEVLARGHALAMYPEGTRSRDFLPFLPGAAWLALASEAPLVPVGITGTAEAMPRGSKIPRRSRVRVAFGEPLSPGKAEKPRARLERARELTVELRALVGALMDPA